MKALISPNEGYRVVEVADKEFEVSTPLFWVNCSKDVSPEWIYHDGIFINPNTLISRAPISVSMRQARLAMLQRGILSEVNDIILSLPEPQRTVAQIEWEYSQEVNRNFEIVKIISSTLKLTEQDLDELFTLASTL